MENQREQMNVVIVGHVDHGKSTLIGRLLADTGSLPEGKLESVKANCKRNAKPFEYAFLLDALKDEQSQGITIDTARSFFKSIKRDYIIIDAPGHIEFLKNMVTGAARAEAAMLVIDAKEGIRENSKRHGYMMSFLGIRNLTVCVNKMDLVNYDEEVFVSIKNTYTEFLHEINLKPLHFIPISAREGDNIATLSSSMPWYSGSSILQSLDEFQKAAPAYERDFRFPVQDIYKFTQEGDDRRIVAGRVEVGYVSVGDEVIFMPSQKTSRITGIEGFNMPQRTEVSAGESAGFTLETQIYIRPGELMCLKNQRHPHVSTKFKANIFWMGKLPLVKGKNYKLKLATQQVPVVLSSILSVLDASELSSVGNKPQVDRHDVAECIFETLKPVAFDECTRMPEVGRFVVVDNYEIAGVGIIIAPVFEETSALGEHIKTREFNWDRSDITTINRANKNQHKSALIVVTGINDEYIKSIAKALERTLFQEGKNVYYLGLSGDVLVKGENSNDRTLAKVQYIRQLGEIAHIATDSGLLLITSIADIDEYELGILKALNRPHQTISVHVGESQYLDNKVDLCLPVDPDLPDGSQGVIVPAKAISEIMNLIHKAIALDPEFLI